MNNQARNIIVELPPGGIAAERTECQNDAYSAQEASSFTIVSRMNDLTVQSQAESSMSSYVHVSSNYDDLNESNSSSGEWSDEDDDEHISLTRDRIVGLRQIQQDLMVIPASPPRQIISATIQTTSRDERRKRIAKLRADVIMQKKKQEQLHRKKKQKLEIPPTLHQAEKALSIIEEAYGDSIQMDALKKLLMDDPEDDYKNTRASECQAQILVQILNRTKAAVPNAVNLAKDLDELKSEFIGFPSQSKTGKRTVFIGFKIENHNKFCEIQLNGLDCERPGFHLCKTVENAISFWRFGNNKENTSSEKEHLWIVLGTEASSSSSSSHIGSVVVNAGIPPALPLACMDIQSIDKHSAVLDKLVIELTDWVSKIS